MFNCSDAYLQHQSILNNHLERSQNNAHAGLNDITVTVEFTGGNNRSSQSISLSPEVILYHFNFLTIADEILLGAQGPIKKITDQSEHFSGVNLCTNFQSLFALSYIKICVVCYFFLNISHKGECKSSEVN